MSQNRVAASEVVRSAYAHDRMDRATAQRAAEALGITADLPEADGTDADANGQQYWLTANFKQWAATAPRARVHNVGATRSATETVELLQQRIDYHLRKVASLEADIAEHQAEIDGIPERIKFYERGGKADYEGQQSAKSLREKRVELEKEIDRIRSQIVKYQGIVDEAEGKLKWLAAGEGSVQHA